MAPKLYRIVHLIENAKFSATGIALLQMASKIPGVGLTTFAIKKSDQVFGSMTNWSFACVSHDYYLRSISGFAIAKLLKSHLQLPERGVKTALDRAQRNFQGIRYLLKRQFLEFFHYHHLSQVRR